MDEADIAQRNQEVFDRQNLARQLQRIPQGEAATDCENCGNEIPAERRRAAPGCRRCVRCQQNYERNQGLRR